jgi:mannose-6-phosphate isomerase-like protein (cupin superfamily)
MKQEEVYVVLRGSGRMKVDDEIVELKEWDAVRGVQACLVSGVT